MIMLKKYPDVLNVKQLCEVLGIGKNTAYSLLKNGEIKCVKIGHVYKIPKKYVKEYILKFTK